MSWVDKLWNILKILNSKYKKQIKIMWNYSDTSK